MECPDQHFPRVSIVSLLPCLLIIDLSKELWPTTVSACVVYCTVFVFVSKYHGIRADGFGCRAALYAVDRSVSRLFWQWMSENTDVDAVAVKYGA